MANDLPELGGLDANRYRSNPPAQQPPRPRGEREYTRGPRSPTVEDEDEDDIYGDIDPRFDRPVPPRRSSGPPRFTSPQAQRESPPKPNFVPEESPQIIPPYVIDNYLRGNGDSEKDGFFCVFKKTYVLKSDGKTKHEGPIPSNQSTLWVADKVMGHLFEVTLWGSLVYHGLFRDNEKDFTAYWSKKSVIKELRNPMFDNPKFFWIHYRNHEFDALIRHVDLPKASKAADTLVNPDFSRMGIFHFWNKSDSNGKTAKFPSFASMNTLPALLSNGTAAGTWKRLFNPWPGTYVADDMELDTELDQLSHHSCPALLLYFNVPRLIAHIISLGICQPKFVSKFMSYRKVGARAGYIYRYGIETDSSYYDNVKYIYSSIDLRIPPTEWKDGSWMYTELVDMDVLIS
ncbi:hypothetical protein H072_4924 [Dactylellina haptotyla CBS 200.50]|uniref:Uncharacterized protein n=1 Tax=Dactylellina haptotyla (strain CBS 200.50) TaxID=1284197 RepID=S8BNX2_DACHA|nr:hypothetical protein H072_4924 [Dactylellina haptotyla CBS 200.50]